LVEPTILWAWEFIIMKEEAEINYDDLRQRLEGDLLDSDLDRSLYSSGPSIFRVKPRAIVRPKNKDDVVKTIQFARQHRVPITAKGGGSSRVGNDLGTGIVIDFCKYMNRILEFDPANKWVRVEPGIILADLNNQIKANKLYFPIDPSTKDWCSLGGMIANNSSGPHAVKYGTTRKHVAALELVLADGEFVQTGKRPLSANESAMDRLGGRVASILGCYEKALEEEKPFTTKNSCGYYLWDLFDENNVDLTPMFVGSEGTLGVVTEAKLYLSDIPEKALSGLAYFDELGKVGKATQEILEVGPSMVEIMERHILDLAREQKPEMREYLPEGIEAVLFIEFQEDSDETLRDKFAQVRKRLLEDNDLAIDLKEAKSAADMDTFAKVRRISGPILNRMKGPRRPLAFIEDAAVHPSRLPEYISGLRGLFEKFNVSAAIYGHAGDGNLHNMGILDLRQQQDVDTMLNLSEDVADLVLKLKGTVSGEHADGRLRTFYVQRQYPELYKAMAEVKDLLDPERLLNPGIIISNHVNQLGKDLKFGPDYKISFTNSVFDLEEIQHQVENCSGCGKCRFYCAIASNMLEEWAKGRGKITLVREIVSGKLDPAMLNEPGFKEIMDSCINCKRCLTECPSGVDTPWVALMGRADYVKKHGEDLTNKILLNTAALCKAASSMAPMINLANRSASIRSMTERLIGVERERKLPKFSGKSLHRMFKDKLKRTATREAVFFLNCFSNYNDPRGEGMAIINVLEKNGINVLVPELKCCGIARITAGAAHKVMKDINENIRVLSEYANQGLPIVFTEPSCALAVKEYPRITGFALAKVVADHCYDISQFLMQLHQAGKLNLDFGRMDLSIGYHNPCHLRTQGVTKQSVELLNLIPGVTTVQYSDKCCGMGGTYGLKKKNYDLSMKIGQRLFDEINASGVDKVATECSSCAMQIKQGTNKDVLHPVALLALAYQRSEKSNAA